MKQFFNSIIQSKLFTYHKKIIDCRVVNIKLVPFGFNFCVEVSACITSQTFFTRGA